MNVKRNKEARSRNKCCRENVTSIKSSECVCFSQFLECTYNSGVYRVWLRGSIVIYVIIIKTITIMINLTKLMHPIILSPVACLALTHFPTISHKRHGFRKIVTEHQMYVLIFSTTLPETFFILRSSKRDIIINVNRFSCKVPIVHVRRYWNFKWRNRVSKYTQI